MRIADICTRSVVTCKRNASVLDVARLMRDCHVGDVIVVDEVEGRPIPVGIVTDRDLVVAILAEGIGAEGLCAGDLIVNELITAFESELVYDAIWHMRSKGIRRLPIINAQCHLMGVLTADDVTRFLAEELASVARITPRQLTKEGATRDSVGPAPSFSM